MEKRRSDFLRADGERRGAVGLGRNGGIGGFKGVENVFTIGVG